jgi:hypothetical protein
MGMGVERSRSMKINYIIRNNVSNLLMIVSTGWAPSLGELPLLVRNGEEIQGAPKPQLRL